MTTTKVDLQNSANEDADSIYILLVSLHLFVHQSGTREFSALVFPDNQAKRQDFLYICVRVCKCKCVYECQM